VSDHPKKTGAEVEGDEPEAAGGTLPRNPELEDALREAMESVEGRAKAPPVEEAESAPAGDEAAEAGHESPADELARTKDRMLRLQADFENFRRRALQERRDIYQYGHENLVKDLLSTVDNLERAIGHARESGGGDLDSFLQGVDLVYRELLGILGNHSVREVEALGKTFDPAVHEAMAQIEDGSVAPNTVIEVLQKGYQLRDRLLRPSRVIVAKAPEQDSDGEGEAAG
jgi:molecular chaperone GrpE